MSRDDLFDPADRPANPARRHALFAAGEAMLAAAASTGLPALAQPRAAAPALHVMHGFADHTSMTLWMQGSKAHSLRVEASAAGTLVRSESVPLNPRNDFTETLLVGGLDPGTKYDYAIRPEGGGETLARGAFRTQVHWQYRTDPPTVRIATGSCAYLNDFRFDRPGRTYGAGEEIFDSIAAADPDLMLWLGDNIYLRETEHTNPDAINRRYRFYRAHERLQKLWTATSHVAIWDDHDFGPNNSDFSNSSRGWTTEAFLRYWPLPYAPTADGLYGKATVGDVDLFLLDDRTHRYPERWAAGADKVMYGARQMLWLRAALTYSRAPFKLVCGGSQFFNRAGGDAWVRYGTESAELLRFLEERRIPGVIFLSGDRHFTEHLRVQRQGGLYPINELTISPLTSGPTSSLNEAERNNPDLVPGSLYDGRNFALLTASGPRTRRALSVEVRDTRGAKVWEWQTTAAELAAGTRT